MRSLIALVVAAGSFAVLTAEAQACSARGTFCGHPAWAANAFEGPRGSHAKGIIDLKKHHYYKPSYGYASGYSGYGYKPAYRAKKRGHKTY